MDEKRNYHDCGLPRTRPLGAKDRKRRPPTTPEGGDVNLAAVPVLALENRGRWSNVPAEPLSLTTKSQACIPDETSDAPVFDTLAAISLVDYSICQAKNPISGTIVAVRAIGRLVLRAVVFVFKLIVAFALGISVALAGLIAGHYIPHFYRR